MLRTVAGAGRPALLVDQAQHLVETFTAAAASDPNRAYPYYSASQAIGRVIEYSTSASPEERIINSIIQASLRLAASRMLDQPTQERAAQHALDEALDRLRAT
jgi:hypothetical protein